MEEECRVREVVEETEEVWGERWERRGEVEIGEERGGEGMGEDGRRRGEGGGGEIRGMER